MKKLLSLLILLCCYAQAALAGENVFSLSTYEFEPGTTQTVYVQMDVPDTFGGFQFDLYLPEGVSIITSGKNKPKLYEEGPWGEDDAVLSCTKRANGSYRFLEYANVNAAKHPAAKGIFIEMQVETSADAPTGPAKVEFKEVALATADGTDWPQDDVEYDAQVVGSYSISASSSDEAKGSVEITGGGENVKGGTDVTVTATPVAGFEFVNWTADGTEVSTENPYKFTASQNIVLVGNFKAKKYDVTFVFGNGTEDSTQSLELGSPITKPEDPVRTGYTFEGWNPALEEGATVPVDGITYTAVWTINSYKLTYKVDGETYKEMDVEYGAEIKAEAAPEKEGYTFSGWEGLPETMPANDVVVTGSFTVNSYNAVFKLEGEVLETKSIAYGEKVTAPEAPAKEGYTFGGWQDVPETMPAHDIEIIGVYNVKQYKLTYMVDGETYKEVDVDLGAEIKAEAAPEKEGYTFSGWEGLPEIMPANDVVVTGSFTVNSYNAVFKLEGEVLETKSIAYGEKVTAPEAPAKEGYTFGGWQDVPETMPAHDIEIIGVYNVNQYKLTYMVDGETYKEVDVDLGAEIKAEAAPEKEGYTFSGWEGLPETMPAKDVVVTGSFTVNSYNAVFKLEGEVLETKSIVYGEKVTAPEVPAKEGYTFGGWQDVPEIMPAHDIEITGAYTVNSYKLIYEVDGKTYKEYEVEYGATITPEADPVEEGRAFSGWVGLPETMPAHDVTVSGTFSTNNSYKAVFKIGEEMIVTKIIVYGEKVIAPEVPAKEGYTFGGWKNLPETMPAHDIEVIGEYTVNQYKLTYKVDGETYKEMDVEYGAEIKAEAAPEKEGYTFSGWEGLPETMPANDVAVTGSFTVNSYNAVFKLDGEVLETKSIVYGEKVETPEAPAKEGYTFGGWQDVPETMPAHDIEVIGAYTVNLYKLTYMVDGETYKEVSVDFGAEIKAEAAPEKEGYTFSGWEGLPETMPAKDVVVTGSFTVNSYNAVFKLEGEVLETKSIAYGEKVTAPEAPAKEGYTFGGWQDVPETMPAHDIEIIGVYNVNQYKLTYMVDGETYKEVDVDFGAEIKAEAAPEKEGYTFSGWEGLPETMPAKDVTVNGAFTVNKYRLSLYLNDKLYYSELIEFGAPVKVDDPEVPEGSKFDGWKDEIPEFMPAHDVDIYGTYSATSSITSVGIDDDSLVTIFTVNGQLLHKDVRWDDVKNRLANGLYIINGTKRLIVR